MSNEPGTRTGRWPAVFALLSGWAVGPLFGVFLAAGDWVEKDLAEILVMVAVALCGALSLASLVSAAVALWQARSPLNLITVALVVLGVGPLLLFWAAFAGLMAMSAIYF